jgi:hypothetical protein
VGSSAVCAGLRPLGPKIIRASKPLRSWWRVSLRLRGRRVHGADLATITLAFIALGLTAAEPRDFRAADTQSNDHPTARALVHMSELVNDRTQGRHRMIVYPGGVLGEQEASFEQTRTGGIDINRTNMAPLGSFVGKAIPVQPCDALSLVRFTGPTDRAVYANRTLHAEVPFALRIGELMTLDLAGNGLLIRAQIRNVVDYSAKLGRRPVADEVDLFTVLPATSTRSQRASSNRLRASSISNTRKGSQIDGNTRTHVGVLANGTNASPTASGSVTSRRRACRE